MRTPEQQGTALECLKLAATFGGEAGDVILAAKEFYAFAADDSSSQVVDAVRKVISDADQAQR